MLFTFLLLGAGLAQKGPHTGNMVQCGHTMCSASDGCGNPSCSCCGICTQEICEETPMMMPTPKNNGGDMVQCGHTMCSASDGCGNPSCSCCGFCTQEVCEDAPAPAPAPSGKGGKAGSCTTCGASCSRPGLPHGTCNAALKCVAKKKAGTCPPAHPAPVAKTTNVNWAMPTSPNHITVNVGDSVKFTWTGNHNVVTLNSGDFASCSMVHANALTTTTNGGSFTWNASHAGDFYFACAVGNGYHCKAGMKIQVTVQAAAGRKLVDCPPLHCPFQPVCMPPSVLKADVNLAGCTGCPHCVSPYNCTDGNCLPCCKSVQKIGGPPCRDCGFRG